MQIKSIAYGSHFLRSLKKLPWEVQVRAAEKELVFCKNCFAPGLKTHKLTGKWEGCWAFSVNYFYRVLFRFENASRAEFINIGDHSIYQ